MSASQRQISPQAKAFLRKQSSNESTQTNHITNLTNMDSQKFSNRTSAIE